MYIIAQVNFRIDDNLKKKVDHIFNDMGLTMSAAITMFLVQVSREYRIPFQIKVDPFYSDENIKELEQRIESIKNGSNSLEEHELL